MNAWVVLALAIICEILASSSLKQASLSGKHFFILIFAIFMSSSFALLYYAMKSIDLSVGYAVWSGVGVLLISIVGFVIFKEEMSFFKILFLSFIIIGVVGLKLISKT